MCPGTTPWLMTERWRTEFDMTSDTPPAVGTRLAAKTRYRQADADCVVTSIDGKHFELTFSEPQWAVTPGQSAVLYQGEVSLGGGVIESATLKTLDQSTIDGPASSEPHLKVS